MQKQKPQKDYIYLSYKGKEYLWMFFTCISILLAGYCLLKSDNQQALYFIVLTFIAGILYSFFRSRRRKYEVWLTEKKEK